MNILVVVDLLALFFLGGAIYTMNGTMEDENKSLHGKLERMETDYSAKVSLLKFRVDSLEAYISSFRQEAVQKGSRKEQVATGAKIIRKFRKNMDFTEAANLAGILYDESCLAKEVDYPFLLAIVASESRFNVNAVSPAGAIGLGQLMPATAEKMAKYAGIPFDRGMLGDPRYNIKLSIQYLVRLNRQFNNRMLVAAAYNGGPGGASKYNKWLEGEADQDSVNKETMAYVDKVMDLYATYSGLLNY